jgi:glycosyltransferase involved in cell wall biosynthesis
VLKLDSEDEYTLLVRPEGKKTVEQFFKLETRNSKLETISNFQKNKYSKHVSDFGFRISDFKNLKIQILDIPHYSIKEQTVLLRYLNKEKFDLVHFTQFNHPLRYRGKFIVTVHDMTMIGHLHRQSFSKKVAFGWVMRSAAKKSAKILTVSKYSKNEILDYYNISPSKIVVTYLGVDPQYNPNVRVETEKISRFKKDYGINDNYILYTGMWKRHKNIMRMLQAFERYAAENGGTECGLQLVLTGKVDANEPEVISEIKRINQSHKYRDCDLFISTGFIKEEELPIAYAGAKAYIIPSLNEGFGLPPLEAMACGTPVIASRESCIPEVLGDAALYFDPYNVDAVKKAMAKIISDNDLRKDLIKKGQSQSAKYDWTKTAKETFEEYKKVLNTGEL